ncbi:molecular chaperone [Salmonella enterica]|nr:molecular chaperone [Salmonella enterica]
MLKKLIFAMLVLSPAFYVFADGGIYLGSTRVIFNENDSAKSVKVNNTSKDVFLMRSWISYFNNQDIAKEWVVTPPIYKLNGDDAIQVRISSLDSSLFPADRESSFYLNVLTIPSTDKVKVAPTDSANGQINVALNSRIKVFYRPAKIFQEDMNKIFEQIKFEADGNNVRIINPTAFNINFSEIKINKKIYNINRQLVAPFSSVTIAVSEKPNTVTYQIINDFGGVTQEKTQNLK